MCAGTCWKAGVEWCRVDFWRQADCNAGSMDGLSVGVTRVSVVRGVVCLSG